MYEDPPERSTNVVVFQNPDISPNNHQLQELVWQAANVDCRY